MWDLYQEIISEVAYSEFNFFMIQNKENQGQRSAVEFFEFKIVKITALLISFAN
jgi:hypothetical protein